MTPDLDDELAADETVAFTTPLRRGDSAVVTDRRLLVVEDETEAIPLPAIESLQIHSVDWNLAVLSVLLVALGGYLLNQSNVVGYVFVPAGLVSLWLTYRARGKVLVKRRDDEPKLAFYPDDREAFHEAIQGVIDDYQAKVDERYREEHGDEESP